MEDGTVTILDRDTMAQDQVVAENVRDYFADRIRAWTSET